MSAIDGLVDLPERTWAETIRLYFEITRPKVMALVVFTGAPALWLGQATWPGLAQTLWVLTGTALAGAASSAINAWFERDVDARMARTRNRPLPAAALLPRVVLGYGLILTLASAVVLGLAGGPLAMGVGLATIAFYVGVYTMWLKRRTPQNIVIGGAAGATAPLIASAAMGNGISVGAWVLFAIIFLWTPPHFWAVAIYRKSEYAQAGLPMMPLIVGDQSTRWRSLAYTLALLPVTLFPVWTGDLGPLYAVAATLLGGWFLVSVVQSLRAQRPAVDRTVFRVSIAYLTLLFAAMLIDLVLPWGMT